MAQSIEVTQLPPQAPPSPVAISDWNFRENFQTAQKPPSSGNFVAFNVPLGLTERRIYFLFDTKSSAAGNIQIEMYVELFHKGKQAGQFPANVASLNGATASKGFPTLFQAGGVVVQDSLYLVLPITTDLAVPALPLQALRLHGEIDELRLRIAGFSDASNVITGYYCFLGCLSSKH